MLSAEFGFEYHLGYENDSGTVAGTVTYDYEGDSGSEPWFGGITSAEEGLVKLSIMAVTAGARFNFPVPGALKPYAGGGFLYAISSKMEAVDVEYRVVIEDSYIKGTNMGAYFGGGVNWFVTPAIALNIPVKYRLFFEGKYDAYDRDGNKYDYVNPDSGNLVALDAKLKPAGILTFGLGIEVFPF
ncbi:MAG: hypothetical protein GY771_04180, partial [bacterium]|nr:hypothetical protein [bacterium]